jgi:hypothetical protein
MGLKWKIIGGDAEATCGPFGVWITQSRKGPGFYFEVEATSCSSHPSYTGIAPTVKAAKSRIERWLSKQATKMLMDLTYEPAKKKKLCPTCQYGFGWVTVFPTRARCMTCNPKGLERP